MMGIDWGETDSFLSQQELNRMVEETYMEKKRKEAELRAYEKRKEAELRAYEKRKEMENILRQTSYTGYSPTQRASEPLSLKGVRDAVKSMKNPTDEYYTQVNKWMNDAYEKLLTPMASHVSGYMRIKPRDMDGEYEYKNKFFKLGMEPNYFSGLRAREIIEDECPQPFSRGEEDEKRKKIMDLITDISPDESPMAKMFSSTTTATEHQWLKYEKKNDSKAHDLFWQSYRRTGKLPFTATHHKKD